MSTTKLVKCRICEGPVIRGSERCNQCATPLAGDEPRYLFVQPQRASVRPLVTQFLVIAGVTLLLTGFNPSPMWRVFLSAVMIYYLVRAVRIWYSN